MNHPLAAYIESSLRIGIYMVIRAQRAELRRIGAHIVGGAAPMVDAGAGLRAAHQGFYPV